jgi:hypothetical protein
MVNHRMYVVAPLVVGIFFLGIWPALLHEAADEAATFLFPT